MDPFHSRDNFKNQIASVAFVGIPKLAMSETEL